MNYFVLISTLYPIVGKTVKNTFVRSSKTSTCLTYVMEHLSRFSLHGSRSQQKKVP